VFLCGGFTMGFGVGLVLLFSLRATPLAGHFTVARVQVATGLIAVLIAVVLATNVSLRKLIRRATVDAAGGRDAGVAPLERTPPSGLQKLAHRARCFRQGDSLLVAGLGGLGAALPSANYTGSMAAILASHAAPVVQAEALFVFNLVAFTMAEIPVFSYLAAPEKTRAFIAALQTWLRTLSHRDVAVLVAAGGCFILVLGLTNL
jgi:hypothetical protein